MHITHMFIDYSVFNNYKILLETGLEEEYEIKELQNEFSEPLKERFNDSPKAVKLVSSYATYKKLFKFCRLFTGGYLEIRTLLRILADPTKLSYDDALWALIGLCLIGEYVSDSIDKGKLKERIDVILNYYEYIYDHIHEFDEQ